MIIAFRSRLSVDELFTFSFWGMVALTAVIFLYFLIALMKTPVVEGVRSGAMSTTVVSGAKIFTGPLSLRENQRSPLAISLEQKLTLLAQCMRPDVKAEEKVFCIGVQGTDERQVVREGEAIFAQITPHPSGGVESVAFVEEGVGTPMIPHVLDGHSILLKVDEMEVILKASIGSGKGASDHPGIGALASAKWWGTDRLFETYGGEEYRPLSQKQKVEVGGEMLFLGADDYLSFVEGKWQVLPSLFDASREAPLAHVQSVRPNALVLEAWDQDGFPVFQGEIALQPRGSFRVASEQLMAETRMRSAKQISCLMDKKRMTLKEGDWLLKGKSGWMKLKTVHEIEAFLHHELQGELFVIDQIDPNGHLKGNYFDVKRIHMQPIALRIVQQPQQKTPTQTRKRGHLSKL